MDLPMKAFCLYGNDGKIELTINEILGFPERTSIEGGYDFKGTLDVKTGSYEVHCVGSFFSATGILCRFMHSLMDCYNSFEGTASYRHLYDRDFEFDLRMTKHGHAVVEGTFTEYPHLPNKLVFQMETDQTCILSAINELKKVEEIFAGIMSKRP